MKKYPKPKYYMFIGERSNGKTYSSLQYALERYCKYGEQFAYVRRFGEDIRKKQMVNLFSAHVANNEISKLTNGEWSSVDYTGTRFYLYNVDEKGKINSKEDVFGFCFDLNSMEHYKSISFPRVTTIIFDEFLSRSGYLNNEFLLFTNVLSTIIRHRDNVKILMLGNTVNKYCPYFAEMGISHIKDQEQGTVDIYRYGNTGLEVAVEYCESTSKRGGKKSDVYFAFDNPELAMITKGSWEIGTYPHLTEHYLKKDVALNVFFKFDSDIIHGEIVVKDNAYFIFFHRKTTPIKDEDCDIVYSTEPIERWNYRTALTKQTDKVSKKIIELIRVGKAFYSDNEVGEIIRNYLQWSLKISPVN